ncbi:FYVE zinc finger-domain-containing protein [Thelonectria olida]|uniref:RING-type E3 ubiquitin transferase n=1 Tax=Thelonectria olida TaxID=1576542 RepID=A0A9P9ANX1_9HYPO|nr:FYVE zinc finger-domain-containing protein [Thelonectria olida]
MASPSGDPIPFSGAAAQMYADLRQSESDSDSDHGSDTSSAFTASDLDRTRNICRYRTPQFHDRECSRFFDCPSHIVERSLSEAGSIHETTHDGIDAADASPASHRSSTHGSTTNLSDHERQHDVDAHSARQSPESNEASSSAISTHSIGQSTPPPNLNPAPNASDIISTLEALQMTPPQAEADTSPYTRARRQYDPSTEHAHRTVEPATVEEQGLSGLPEPRRERTPVSRERMDAPLPSPRRQRTLSETLPPLPQPPRGEVAPATPAEWSLPRWQSDAEVTYCPICRAQFSFFVRKHHCRKCGRVVCNSCSPHRIIIPYQYIVRPPGSEVGVPQSLLIDGLGTGYFNVSNVAGGERVRLCNPCVPDPNTAPPQSPNSSATLSPRPAHTRSLSSAGASLRALPGSNRHGAVFAPGTGNEPYQYLRTRSITVGPQGTNSSHGSSSRRPRSGTHQTPIGRIMSASSSSSYPHRYSSLLDVGSSSRQRALPPTPQIAEEDECPICHRELPSQTLPNFEALRESHIATCIQSHSTYGTPREGDTSPAVPRRTGMYTYPATEKDCIDDAECTICLEEFTVGIPMARLECLCRFHRSCISAWFVNHPGRCPVHQHDGFGY